MRHSDTDSLATTTPAPEATLRVYLLGGFRLVGRELALPDSAWRLRKARSLVKLLALAPAQALPREEVMDALWPDLDPAAAANNLRGALHAARRTLAPHWLIVGRGDTLALRAEGSDDTPWIDAVAFELAAAAARRAGDAAAYTAALDLYGGELLPEDRYEDWTAGRRDFLRGLHHDLLRELAALHERAGDWPAAIAALRHLLAADPLHEEAHVSLMRALALVGQRSQALAQWDQLVATLRRELDADPDDSARALHDDIAAGDFPPASERAAPTVAARRAHNLPAPPTPLIGRENAVALAAARLRNPAVRLLTLTGPGGVGKSRLALAVAEALLPDYPDGVWFVPLAALGDPALVPAAIAQPLGIAEHGTQPLRETLPDVLRERQILLLLDNLEHLLPATDLIEALLTGCPGLKILVTSRTAPRTRWGHEESVPPLALPDIMLPDPGDIGGIPAVALFAARAAAVRPDFRLDPHNAPTVAAICRRLDGLPLALELAAARARLLSPAALLDRLDAPFRLLTGGSPGRHQTLRDTIAWSYDLLRPDEQGLFRCLAAFPGGCAITTAEAICAELGGARDALDLAESLVAQSLVRQFDGPGGEPRLTLFETIREYGWEQLAATGEAEAVRDWHAAHYLALAEEAAPQLIVGAQERWLVRLEADLDNLRAALRFLLNRRDAVAGMRLSGALWRFWYLRGYFAEGRHWLEASLALPCDEAIDANAAVRALALYGASTLTAVQGELRLAEAQGEASLTLRRRLGNHADTAATLNTLAYIAQQQRDSGRATILWEECLVLWRASLDDWGVAAALVNLGTVAQDRGDARRAAALFEESLLLKRTLDDRLGMALVLNNLAEVASRLHGPVAARARHEESLALARTVGHHPIEAIAINNLGAIAHLAGDYVGAAMLFEDAIRHFREIGDRTGLASALTNLGAAHHQLGDEARARTLHEESLAVAHAADDHWGTARALVNLGALALARGDAVEAITRSEEAVAIFRAIDGGAEMPCALGILARALLARGDRARAEALWREALDRLAGTGVRDNLPAVLEGFAALAADQQPAPAARLLGAAAALRDDLGIPVPATHRAAHARLCATLRATLGADAFARATDAGRALDDESASAEALDTIPPPA